MTLIVSADSTPGDRSATRMPPTQLVPSLALAACATTCRIALDDFVITSIDPAIEDTTSIAAAEWRAAGFWDAFVHPEDRSALDDARRTARVGKGLMARFRVRLDDAYLPMLLYGTLSAEEAGVPSGRAQLDGYLMVDGAQLIATTRDLSRQLSAATRDADELSGAVLASFPGFVAAVSADGVVLAANDAWSTLHREAGDRSIATSDVGGNYLTALREAAAGGRSDFVRVYEAVERVLKGEIERARVEYVCETSQRSLVLLVQRLKRAAGGIIVTHLDVTERAQGARSLHQARQELMRAAQLAVAGELVGAITHDIRQPLTALQMDIGVAIHLLRQKAPAVPEALNALEDVLADELRVQESLQVLQDLVARREPRRERIALGAIANEVARLVATEAAARHVVLDLQLATDVATFPGDPTLLREAVLSLLLDAVENAEAIDDRQARVTIATQQLDEARVELRVTHPRRGDAVSNNRWGLSVARSVAEAHRADLVVDSDPESGVTVRTIWPTLADAGNLQA